MKQYQDSNSVTTEQLTHCLGLYVMKWLSEWVDDDKKAQMAVEVKNQYRFSIVHWDFDIHTSCKYAMATDVY